MLAVLRRRQARRRAQRAEQEAAHRRAAEEALRAAAAPVLQAGAATLEPVVDDDRSGWALRPRQPAAAALAVWPGWATTVLRVGDQGVYELWQDGVEERAGLLRTCVAAVVAGRYSERLEAYRRGSLFTMRFDTEPEPIVVREYSGRRSPPEAHGERSYAAYRAE